MSAIAVSAHIRPKPDAGDELRGYLEKLGAIALAEPGCLQWVLFQADDGSFTITELFSDEGAYQAHEDDPDTLRLSAELGPLLEGVEVRCGPVLLSKD